SINNVYIFYTFSLFLSFPFFFFFFFFTPPSTTDIYTLSLHDALPISQSVALQLAIGHPALAQEVGAADLEPGEVLGVMGDAHLVDRKSTRLNSSHSQISYAVFCLKKKKKKKKKKKNIKKKKERIHENKIKH